MHFKKIERTTNMKEKKNIGLSEMHNIFVAADEKKRKTFMKKQINNTKRKKNENSKKTGLKNSLAIASPTNANETDGNLIVPNPSMFMAQLIALTFVIDFFVVSCKCTKPSFTRNSWLQLQEYKWCEEFVVPFIPIHFGNGCFFTTTCFRFHQNQH